MNKESNCLWAARMKTNRTLQGDHCSSRILNDFYKENVSSVWKKKNQDETTLHRRPGKPPHIKKWTNSFAHKVKLKEDDRQQTKDRMEMCLKRDNETSRVQVTEFCNFSTQLGQRCFSLEEKLQRKTFLVSARLFSAPVPVRYKWKMYLFKDCTLAGENWGWNW